MKYKTKQQEINAIQLNRNFFDIAKDFIGIDNIDEYNSGEFIEDTLYITIHTKHGVITAYEYEYIVNISKNEFIVLSEYMFKKMFEKDEG